MERVFISYSHDDFEFAESLQLRLDKEGFETWMDVERLNAGEDWREEIDVAIKNSFALLLILTPKALESRYVSYEWSFAWGAGKKVIPLLLIQVDDNDIHPRLDRRQYLDFTTRKGREWDKLFGRLSQIREQVLNNYKVDATLDDLENDDSNIRIAAIQRLAKTNNKSSIPRLLKCLRDRDAKVRRAAVIALGEIGDPEVVDELRMVLASNPRPSDVRSSVIVALGKIGTESAAELLAENLHMSDIGFPAANELATIGYIAIPYVIRAMSDSWAHRPAISTFSQMGSITIPFLINALQDDEYQIRAGAARSLGKLNALDATEQIIALLKDKTYDVQLAAINALEKIATFEALAAVEEWRRNQQT
jgi:hypothetical protein